MNIFLRQLREELQQLADDINVILPHHQTVTIRGLLLCGVCDIPAKHDSLNLFYFNEDSSCCVSSNEGQGMCLNPGHLQVDRYGNANLRTSANTIADAENARVNEPSHGVKGLTVFSNLIPDFMTGMAIDRMHGLEGGVFKKLLFSPEYRNSYFSTTNVVDALNTRLLPMKPPKFIDRMPRLVGELVNWKASELNHSIHYYSIPVF